MKKHTEKLPVTLQAARTEILALRAERDWLRKSRSALQLAILSLDTDGEKSALAALRTTGRNALK